MWVLESLQQCKNFFGIIALQFVGHPPGSSMVGLQALILGLMTEVDESQAGIKIDGRNVNNLRYAEGTTLVAES